MKQLAARARCLAEARSFFASRGYLEVETPIAVPSPGLDVHLDAFSVVGTANDGELWLSTSPEYQMKRLLADGHARIFQMTRAFRAGERGSRHNPEFSILEFYRANAGVDAIMRDTEQLVARLSGGAVTIDGQRIDTTPPFDRIAIADAFAKYAGTPADEAIAMADADEDRFFRVLVDIVEPALAAHPRAIFVTDYPASQASLARKNPRDPRVAERFELYVAGVEVCNGFGELTDPIEQRARFVHDREVRATLGKTIYPMDERFLAALVRGMPDAGGNAVGFDRLVALVCGTTSIADVMAFTADEL